MPYAYVKVTLRSDARVDLRVPDLPDHPDLNTRARLDSVTFVVDDDGEPEPVSCELDYGDASRPRVVATDLRRDDDGEWYLPDAGRLSHGYRQDPRTGRMEPWLEPSDHYLGLSEHAWPGGYTMVYGPDGSTMCAEHAWEWLRDALTWTAYGVPEGTESVELRESFYSGPVHEPNEPIRREHESRAWLSHILADHSESYLLSECVRAGLVELAESGPIPVHYPAPDVDPDDFAKLHARSHETAAEFASWCPACGEPSDSCQGHGDLGDPDGSEVLTRHDTYDDGGPLVIVRGTFYGAPEQIASSQLHYWTGSEWSTDHNEISRAVEFGTLSEAETYVREFRDALDAPPLSLRGHYVRHLDCHPLGCEWHPDHSAALSELPHELSDPDHRDPEPDWSDVPEFYCDGGEHYHPETTTETGE